MRKPPILSFAVLTVFVATSFAVSTASLALVFAVSTAACAEALATSTPPLANSLATSIFSFLPHRLLSPQLLLHCHGFDILFLYSIYR